MVTVFAGSSLAVRAPLVLIHEIDVERHVLRPPVVQGFGNQALGFAGDILRRKHGNHTTRILRCQACGAPDAPPPA
jgi:hypothetical protein